MDMKKIGRMVEERRVLTGFRSYPMIVEFRGARYMIWFNYMIPESEDEMHVVVTDAFCVNEQYEVEKKKLDARKECSAENIDEPEIEYEEYLEKLDELYPKFHAQEMEELILKTEDRDLLKIYDDIKTIFFK